MRRRSKHTASQRENHPRRDGCSHSPTAHCDRRAKAASLRPNRPAHRIGLADTPANWNARRTTGRGQPVRSTPTHREPADKSPIPLITGRFQVLFTLFSKFFSSFVHTTCSLSVSKQYLAFAEAHQRFCTAFPNCTTLGRMKRC